jgi:hypothetical protein
MTPGAVRAFIGCSRWRMARRQGAETKRLRRDLPRGCWPCCLRACAPAAVRDRVLLLARYQISAMANRTTYIDSFTGQNLTHVA